MRRGDPAGGVRIGRCVRSVACFQSSGEVSERRDLGFCAEATSGMTENRRRSRVSAGRARPFGLRWPWLSPSNVVRPVRVLVDGTFFVLELHLLSGCQ